MPDNENASTFLEAINKYAQQQKNQIQSEVEKFKREELIKAENEVLNDAYKLIQKEMADMRKSITSEISKKEMNAKKELLKKREGLFKEVFKKTKEKLIKYTRGTQYPKLLIAYAKNINSVLKEQGTILYIKHEDLKYKELIKSSFENDCKVLVDDHIDIGGIRAVNENMGLVVDETLDAKLYHQRDWFEQNSGLSII